MVKRKTETQKPSMLQLITLKAYAKWAGADWKAKLMLDWHRAGSRFPGEYGYLQQVRNTFGPSWLRRFEFESKESEAAKIEKLRASRDRVNNARRKRNTAREVLANFIQDNCATPVELRTARGELLETQGVLEEAYAEARRTREEVIGGRQ